MKQFNDFKKDIERELMIKIIIGLRHGNISQAKAQRLAQEYLSVTNAENSEELFTNMGKLVEKYSEILEVYLKTANEYFDQKKDSLLQAGRKYMHQAQYDVAVSALKGMVK